MVWINKRRGKGLTSVKPFYRGGKKIRKSYKGKGGKLTLRNKALQPIPQRYICRMKYVDNLVIGNGVSPYAEIYYRLNSVYDPYGAAGGHQPYGFDQISPLFTGYRVFSASWRVTFSATTYAHPENFMAICLPIGSATTSPITSIGEKIEKPRARYAKFITGGGEVAISGKVYLPSLMGVSVREYKTDNNYSSAVGGNPLLPATLGIYAANLDEVTPLGVTDVNVTVELIYSVEFIGSVLQAQS